MSDTQKRKHERLVLSRTLAKLSLIKEQLEFEVELVNISHTGVAVLTKDAITKGHPIQIQLTENIKVNMVVIYCVSYSAASDKYLYQVGARIADKDIESRSQLLGFKNQYSKS